MAIPEQGSADLSWHEDVNERKRVGQRSERSFPREWGCACGGEFEDTKNKRPGQPDFTCYGCGQTVDPKAGLKAGDYGWLTVSQIPFERGYADDTIIAWDGPPDKPFTGIRKRDAILHPAGPFEPTHSTKATRFHRIKLSNFKTMEELGLISIVDDLPF